MFPIATQCRVLEVSASGFHAWRQRPLSARARADAELTERIRAIHAASPATYGAPRVQVACKRVARLMRSAGWRGASRRRDVRNHRTRASQRAGAGVRL